MSSIFKVFFLILSTASVAQCWILNQTYVSPSEFCKGTSAGNYCNPAYPRSYISCPTSLEQYCPPDTVCQSCSDSGKVKCVPNIWKPIPRMCRGKAPNTSYCAGNSVYECPTGELFRCPSDMKCQKRGLRAYCIPPMAHENPEKLCDNFAEPEKASVCDAYNLKKITSCANGTVSLCPSGQMCDNDNPQAPTTAACKPYESNPNRWCSNKPLMSSFCVPRSEKALLILCSSTPHIFECPTGKCVQELGITAKCIQ